MADGNVEVSRARPCPICGKTDYCSFWTNGKGQEQVVCKRSKTMSDVVGNDGRVYKFLRLSKDNDYTIYQDKETYESFREAEKDEWMKQNQKGPYNPRWNFGSFFGKKKKQAEEEKEAVAPVILQRQSEIERVNWIEPLPHEFQDRFYRNLLKNMVLDDLHREYLHGEGWSDELISSSLAKSLPVKDFIRMKYQNFYSESPYRRELASLVMKDLSCDDLRGYPGAFVDDGGRWTLNGPSGIAFPIYDADGFIYGLRVRMDFTDVPLVLESDKRGLYYMHAGKRLYFKPFKGWYRHEEGKDYYLEENGYWLGNYFKEVKGKYRPVSSFFEDEKELENRRSVNIYKEGCQLQGGTSLYFNPKVDDPTICYVTEGEKKGIYGNCVLRSPLLTFPGVDGWRSLFHGEQGCRMIDKLKDKGVKLFIVVYDADKAENERVLRAQNNVLQAIKDEGFYVGIGNWDMALGKGLDDLLSNGGLPSYDLI